MLAPFPGQQYGGSRKFEEIFAPRRFIGTQPIDRGEATHNIRGLGERVLIDDRHVLEFATTTLLAAYGLLVDAAAFAAGC